jgi:hypothetical protein
MTMWLPGPVYECLPYAYVVAGVLFVAGTAYTGPGPWATVMYGVAGAISLLAGIAVYLKRKNTRFPRGSTSEPTSD